MIDGEKNRVGDNKLDRESRRERKENRKEDIEEHRKENKDHKKKGVQKCDNRRKGLKKR